MGGLPLSSYWTSLCDYKIIVKVAVAGEAVRFHLLETLGE